MFQNLFGKKVERVQLQEVNWDVAFVAFIGALVNVRDNEVGGGTITMQPSQFTNCFLLYLADNKLSVSDHKIDDIMAGYLDYSLQPERYNSLLDLMLKDRAMKDYSSFNSHLLLIAKIFSDFMFSAQDFLAGNSNK